jgi:hypothetical protein
MSNWPTITEIEDARTVLVALRDTTMPNTSLRRRLDAAIHELNAALRGLRQ